ncbi:RNA-directed DNA polymerase, eukaryota [Tanacetum coccineum]
MVRRTGCRTWKGSNGFSSEKRRCDSYVSVVNGVNPLSSMEIRVICLLLWCLDEECVVERDFSNCAIGECQSLIHYQGVFFKKDYVTISDSFVAIMGTWIIVKLSFFVVSIYAPQQPSLRRVLWEYLLILLGRWNGEAILMGDYNEVRTNVERRGLVSNTQSAFVAGRQILDGPFILNEVLDWCKRKKKKALFFYRCLLRELFAVGCSGLLAVHGVKSVAISVRVGFHWSSDFERKFKCLSQSGFDFLSLLL